MTINIKRPADNHIEINIEGDNNSVQMNGREFLISKEKPLFKGKFWCKHNFEKTTDIGIWKCTKCGKEHESFGFYY